MAGRTNAVRCLRCGDVIHSAHRHDYQTCLCGDVSVDGGQSYLKRAWREGARWEEMSTGWELEHMSSGDFRCPACGILNPDVPEGPASARCSNCLPTVLAVTEEAP